MNSIFKGCASVFIFSVLCALSVSSAAADGMVMRPDPYSDRWDYSDETSQQAIINYENGIQQMVLSISIDQNSSADAVWLFPVPAAPNRVVIDIADSFPKLNGEDISRSAQSRLSEMNAFFQATQLYPLPYVFMNSLLGADLAYFGAAVPTNSFNAGMTTKSIPNVVVFEHLEKEGITTEIVTAQTATGLFDYLKGKGLSVGSGSIPVLDSYIGKDYSFVISWIKNPQLEAVPVVNENTTRVQKSQAELLAYIPQDAIDFMLSEIGDFLPLSREYFQQHPGDVRGYVQQHPEFNNMVVDFFRNARPDVAYIPIGTVQQPVPATVPLLAGSGSGFRGVSVTFPTNTIYFPLLPTSVYGSKTVPATIEVIGHVSPRIFEDIAAYTTTKYYLGNFDNSKQKAIPFKLENERKIKYTKIELNAPSKLFTDDLWIDLDVPPVTYLATFVALHQYPTIAMVMVFSSVVSGIVAGLLLFSQLRTKPLKLGLVGLSNCLTIAGVIFTTVFLQTKAITDPAATMLLTTLKEKGYMRRRKVALILFIILMPFALFFITDFPSVLLITIASLMLRMGDIPIARLLSAVAVGMCIFVVWKLKAIKPEDKLLFAQLKSFGIFTWTFVPNDSKKIWFVTFFSILFLIISWLLVKLLTLTL